MHPLPLIIPIALATLLSGCLSPAPSASSPHTVTVEGVEWKRSAAGCLDPQRCADVHVRYQHFISEPQLTQLTERQLGRMLVSLTQPDAVLPAEGGDAELVDDRVGRYLADSYAEGDVSLVSQVLRADENVIVVGLQGTLKDVACEASEMQYMVFDRRQQRLVDAGEMVLPGKMTAFNARLAALINGPDHALAAISAAPLEHGIGVKFRDPQNATQFEQVTLRYDDLKDILKPAYVAMNGK